MAEANPSEAHPSLEETMASRVPLRAPELPSMAHLKLVPSEMVDRIPRYAHDVLGLNERLARYVQFVASLEQQNQELVEDNEQLRKKLRDQAEATRDATARLGKSDDTVLRLLGENRELQKKAEKADMAEKKMADMEEAMDELREIIEAAGIDVPPHLQKRIAEGYMDKFGNFIPPNGHYDADGKWIAGTGHYDAEGNWIPGPGTFDRDGNWVPDNSGARGFYDKDGNWVPNQGGNTGFYDKDGSWRSTEGHVDKDGNWVPGPGTYDKNGNWVPDKKKGVVGGNYDKDGKWVSPPKDGSGVSKKGRGAGGHYDAEGNWIPGDTPPTFISQELSDMQRDSALMQQQAALEKQFLEKLSQQAAGIRQTMQLEMAMHSEGKLEAQARCRTLIDALDKMRARNKDLEAQLKAFEDTEFDRLKELEGMSTERDREIEMLQTQRAQALQDAAESRAAKEQLERAIQQYERLLDALGIEPVQLKVGDYAGRPQGEVYGAGPPPAGTGVEALGKAYGISAGGDGYLPAGAQSQYNPAQFTSSTGPPATAAGYEYLQTGTGGGGAELEEEPQGAVQKMMGGIARFFNGDEPQSSADYRGSADYSSHVGVGPGCHAIAAVSSASVGVGDETSGVTASSPMGTVGSAFAAEADTGAIRVIQALPQNLTEMDQFMLLTDEGAVTVRARASGTAAYLKRMVAVQLFLSPRLVLSVTTAKGGDPLRDDVLVTPYAEGRIASPEQRLLLSAAPRPLSDFAPGAPGLQPLQQVRVRFTLRSVPQGPTVLLKPVGPNTTVGELQRALAASQMLQGSLGSLEPFNLKLYFSPVFITPDVLLGRKKKQELDPLSTLSACQIVDDDILYLEVQE